MSKTNENVVNKNEDEVTEVIVASNQENHDDGYTDILINYTPHNMGEFIVTSNQGNHDDGYADILLNTDSASDAPYTVTGSNIKTIIHLPFIEALNLDPNLSNAEKLTSLKSTINLAEKAANYWVNKATQDAKKANAAIAVYDKLTDEANQAVKKATDAKAIYEQLLLQASVDNANVLAMEDVLPQIKKAYAEAIVAFQEQREKEAAGHDTPLSYFYDMWNYYTGGNKELVESNSDSSEF